MEGPNKPWCGHCTSQLVVYFVGELFDGSFPQICWPVVHHFCPVVRNSLTPHATHVLLKFCANILAKVTSVSTPNLNKEVRRSFGNCSTPFSGACFMGRGQLQGWRRNCLGPLYTQATPYLLPEPTQTCTGTNSNVHQNRDVHVDVQRVVEMGKLHATIYCNLWWSI